MKSINPYLIFDGKAEAAFQFYGSVFGGEPSAKVRYRETPMASKLSAGDQERIVHIALPLTSGSHLMGGDACSSMGQKPEKGTSTHISIETDSPAEAERLFGALSAGGSIMTPLQKTFWGALFGMCTDRFGVPWMVSHTDPPKP